MRVLYSLVVCCAVVWRDGGEGDVVAEGAVGNVTVQSAPNIHTHTHTHTFICENMTFFALSKM